MVSEVAGLGCHINECDGPIAESDWSEVRGAGGEGFMVTLSGVHLEDDNEYIGIGDSTDKHCDHSNWVRANEVQLQGHWHQNRRVPPKKQNHRKKIDSTWFTRKEKKKEKETVAK